LIDHYRKSASGLAGRTQELADETGFFDEDEHWAKGFYPQDWSGGADRQLNTREFYKILHACKNRLKELQAAVFSMKYLDDMDSEEICRELGISSSNYWVLMHRAKVQLRACLEKNWFLR
jgi:RNA polymerase sigma-70 factor (ECF subfamily)